MILMQRQARSQTRERDSSNTVADVQRDAETARKSGPRREARRPARSTALQRGARNLTHDLRRVAFQAHAALASERKHPDCRVVEQAHDIILSGSHANDTISHAVDLNHASNCRLHN